MTCFAFVQPPKPYSFSYGVEDAHYGPTFSQDEKSDGNTVQGSYSVQLPDGRQQIVSQQLQDKHQRSHWN